MKKKTFILLLCGFILFGLTGCGEEQTNNNDDKTMSSVTDNVKGLYLGSMYSDAGIKDNPYKIYYVYKIESNKMRKKLCLVSSKVGEKFDKCDFDDGKTGLYQTYDYEIKNIEKSSSDSDYVNFEAYADDEKEYECVSSFGSIGCTSKDGSHISLKKQD